MSADFKFKGPFQTELAAYISEKRRLGCKYVAEEEIACAFDVLSTDCMATVMIIFSETYQQSQRK